MWEVIMMIVFFLYLTTAPLLSAFYYSKDVSPAFYSILAIILDFACITDIFMTCFTGFVMDFSEKVELSPPLIRKHYLLSCLFVFDVISSLPTELVVRLVFLLTRDHYNVGYLNLLSLLKIYRIRTLLEYMSRTAELLGVSRIVFAPIRYIILSFLVVHWCGCFYYIIPTYSGYVNMNRENRDKSWILRNNVQNLPHGRKYIVCMYKAASALLCIVNIKYKDQLVIEISTSIVVHFLGYVLTSTCLDRLRTEINNYVTRQLIKKVGLFREIPPPILNRIMYNLKPEVYLPKDIIVKAGMIGDCMYFIHYGTVAVYTLTGKEVCHLQDGAYFGEMGLISKDQKRIANVVALETSEIYRLDKKCFNQTIKSLPDLYKKFERIAERRRENTMVMEEIHRKHILEKSMKLMDVK